MLQMWQKGHYSNECKEEQMGEDKTVKMSNKKGTNLIVMNDNQHGYSSDEDNTERPYVDFDFTVIQEANEEHEENKEYDTGTEGSNNEDVNESIDDSYAEDSVDNYDARIAQSIQVIIGCPSTKDYIRLIENNMMPNCPITKADIMYAEDILGPNLGSLKGKTTRTKPSKVVLNTCNDSKKFNVR